MLYLWFMFNGMLIQSDVEVNWYFYIIYDPVKNFVESTWNFVWSYEVCADHFVENSWKNEIQCLFYPIGNAEKV